jgi:phosphoglucosamine mutase
MLFGTDGIRGTINKYPMLPCEILKFSLAIGSMLQKISEAKHDKGYKPKVIIAKDTRLSGYIIESALTAGLAAVGVNVTLVGPMPTASVPMLIKSIRADLGIMITASHNPFYDNGLKIFDENGYKLLKENEEIIHKLQEEESAFADPSELGKVNRLEDVHGRYIEYVKSCFPKELSLEGMRVVVDCANGASYKIAPSVFWELGAEVVSVGVEPNGVNINEGCGAINPGLLSAKVIETRSNIGIALDGDGDRLLLCDEMGKIINGDHVIAVIAKFLQKQGRLKGNGIVVTKLSNSALEKYFGELGLKTYITDVGDKNVAYEMKKRGCNFGGETSGHIILGDYTSTGDGIISALQIMAYLKENGGSASDLLYPFQLTPQKTVSIAIDYNENPLKNSEKSALIEKIKSENPNIRLIVRKSGTESVIRIMAEGKDERYIDSVIEKIREIIVN